MSKSLTKIWVTKYALSSGVFVATASIDDDPRLSHMVCVKRGPFPEYFHGEGKEWHRTEASAEERFEAMRLARIASLQKQAAKVGSLKFSVKSIVPEGPQ